MRTRGTGRSERVSPAERGWRHVVSRPSSIVGYLLGGSKGTYEGMDVNEGTHVHEGMHGTCLKAFVCLIIIVRACAHVQGSISVQAHAYT